MSFCALTVASVALAPLVVTAMPMHRSIDLAQSAVQPVASVDPSRPIQIEVLNAGGVPITCRLTQPPTDDRRVLPNSRVTFGSTQTSYLPLPINFLASAEQQNIGLSLYVTVEDNVVQVVVAQARSDIPGSTAIRIDTSGGVYVF
ncbi:hypothetical protein [Thermocoleostomius sinensis]|uniref:AMIN domain-containing protein n=1 Tax=Thermocoleostomius sinensis A174 TaxID=2016057 RepID=A0A9E9C7J6_9CYAN|nr:hypothetical protein [Thermocoleostomius sinensis]WAL59298.1 hypothetical protein OXH18_19285 [Thermocoleostomius sinensis A174]